MEVKINIEAEQIGETVIDLFKNLSEEKKEELAKDVVKSYLDIKTNQKLNSYWNSETVLADFFKRIDNYLAQDISNNDKYIKAKEKCLELVIEKMPELTLKAMAIAMSMQMSSMAQQFPDLVIKTHMNEGRLNDMMQRMRSC